MSTRYYYRPHTLEVYEVLAGEEDLDVVREFPIEGFGLYDSRRGNLDEAWVAFSRDPADAERIVALLNADEDARQRPTNPVVTAADMSKEPL
jgi:hypothetical protein